MTTNAISNSDDVINSRDVIARIAELEELRDAAAAEPEDGADDERTKETMDDGTEVYTSSDFGNDEYMELKSLVALADEASGYAADWNYGETLIRDSYFKDYAMELAEDIGAIKGNENWPLNCIDWDRAVRELQYDYTSVEFDGVDYWIR